MLSKENKIQLIKNELQNYEATKFTLHARLRVFKELEDDRIEAVEKDLEKVEKAMMLFEKQIEELNKPEKE